MEWVHPHIHTGTDRCPLNFVVEEMVANSTEAVSLKSPCIAVIAECWFIQWSSCQVWKKPKEPPPPFCSCTAVIPQEPSEDPAGSLELYWTWCLQPTHASCHCVVWSSQQRGKWETNECKRESNSLYNPSGLYEWAVIRCCLQMKPALMEVMGRDLLNSAYRWEHC